MVVPQFGVGTFRLAGQTAIDSVKTALEVNLGQLAPLGDLS